MNRRWALGAGGSIAGWIALTVLLGAQQIPVEQQVHIRYSSGQGVVPVYEGWERVPDGSFNMVFGYLNRNHVEELSIPVGPQNNFDPGPADRGQPAYFYPRENHFMFRVNVPKDWDKKKDLVWTVTANGKTDQARATLMDIWEIDRKVEVSNNGGGTAVSNELLAKNQPPTVVIQPAARATVGTPVTLTATVADDGVPTPNAKKRGPRELEPALKPVGPPSPVNVPLPPRLRAPEALSVLWMVWRGPGGVSFDPGGYVKVAEGKAAVKATFSKPGAYVLRAFAHDGLLRTPADVTVSVQ
ncbi:MAG: hypothetical protein HY047_20765 [Acidobacteria bacterium]|nr:hypothetical protein [Acidobacteriota bacterium]